AFIVWISYRTYKNNSPTSLGEDKRTGESVPVSDTTKYISPSTNVPFAEQRPEVKTSNGSYRFVVEVANKKRAFYRYNMLKDHNVPIQISTDDSLNYKLYFTLAATPADTARIRDSFS